MKERPSLQPLSIVFILSFQTAITSILKAIKREGRSTMQWSNRWNRMWGLPASLSRRWPVFASYKHRKRQLLYIETAIQSFSLIKPTPWNVLRVHFLQFILFEQAWNIWVQDEGCPAIKERWHAKDRDSTRLPFDASLQSFHFGGRWPFLPFFPRNK